MLVCAALIVACSTDSRMDRLDEQVDRMIRERQNEALGAAAPKDGRPLAQRSDDHNPSDEAYNQKPSTVNPSRDKLPATLAEPEPAEDDPTDIRMPVSQAEAQAKAPDVLALDLEKSLGIAIAQSRDYLTQRENLYLAALSVLAEEHLWGPRLFSDISAIASGTPEDGEHNQALRLIGEFGVTQRLPYGGSVSATALVNFVQLLKDTTNGVGEGQDAALVLSARLPLLRGAGQVARENRIQVSRNLVYATRRFERFRREFLLDISTRYFDLLQSQAQIANLERQVNNLVWLSDRIQAMAKAGRQPYFEVQRAQQQVLFARNNLLNAQESYSSSLDSFKIQLGLDTIQPIRITPSELMIPEPALEVTSATAVAWDLRLDLQTSYDQVLDSRRRVAVAKNGLLPDLDVVGSLNLRTDPTDQYAGLNLDPSRSSYSAGVVLGLPLDRKLEEIGVRRSLVDLERSKRSHSLLRDRVAQQVRQSVRQISQAKFTLRIQNHNISMAQKRLEGVVLRLAKLAPRDFTDAESDLLEARNRRDRALRDLRVSVLQYLLDTGQMRVSTQGLWLPPANMIPAADPAAGAENESPGDYYQQEVPPTASQKSQQGNDGALPETRDPVDAAVDPNGQAVQRQEPLDPAEPAAEATSPVPATESTPATTPVEPPAAQESNP